MMSDKSWKPDRSLPPALALAFAPVHKRALGMAVGLVCGLLVAGITVFHLIVSPPDGPPLYLLAEYFYGYSISWTGAAVGMAWGFVTGFVAGWFAAFVRNFALAVWLLAVRAKAELSNPFLDHI
jgi:hypothetical protein